ncbi:MAG: pyridoxamine 5'-phosphate oxidase family protein [Candidatus Eiseniibacteriota bacterium]
MPEAFSRLDEDMRAVIRAAHLCFAATVTADGRPNLSPKGTIRVWDDRHLYFLDIASPQTRANLERNAWIELNVVEQLSRRGYRFLGRGTALRGGPEFDEAKRRIFAEEGSTYPVEAVLLVEIHEARELVSPGYLHVPDEATMRRLWRERRAALDAEFDSWVATAGFRPR